MYCDCVEEICLFQAVCVCVCVCVIMCNFVFSFITKFLVLVSSLSLDSHIFVYSCYNIYVMMVDMKTL